VRAQSYTYTVRAQSCIFSCNSNCQNSIDCRRKLTPGRRVQKRPDAPRGRAQKQQNRHHIGYTTVLTVVIYQREDQPQSAQREASRTVHGARSALKISDSALAPLRCIAWAHDPAPRRAHTQDRNSRAHDHDTQDPLDVFGCICAAAQLHSEARPAAKPAAKPSA